MSELRIIQAFKPIPAENGQEIYQHCDGLLKVFYGTHRLGVRNQPLRINISYSPPGSLLSGITYVKRGYKTYELSNHLGNVLTTLSDRRVSGTCTDSIVDFYDADILTISDYYPFGMTMQGRTQYAEKYRFGFNTQEKVDEVASGHYTAEYWEYDSRLIRRWNLDPVPQINISDYAAFRNNPISVVDPLGDKPTPKQAAQMSSDVYNTANGKYKEGEKAGRIGGGWSLSSKDFGITLTDDKSGFNSAIYQRQTGTDKSGNAIFEYAYVTQGSDYDNEGIDWSENGKQAAGQFSQQYQTSTDNAFKLSQKLDAEYLSFAGHSLGGGLASANALKTGYSAITFNAAGLSDYSRTKYGLNKPANIQAYVVEGYILHSSQKLLGLRAEGKITFLPASYIPMAILIFAPPKVRGAAAIYNLIQSGMNHTMGRVLLKMDDSGIK